MQIKKYQKINVVDAARDRISKIFDEFDRMYLSFSGGKDSSVIFHLIMDEAIKRNRKVGVLLIDLEAQYSDTIVHAKQMIEMYKDNIDLYWVCVPLKLRNAVTNFEPQWCCWEEEKKEIWVREKPEWAKTQKDLPFFIDKMEFEEFMVLFGEWYSHGENCAAFIGIRCDESLHRYCAIATWEKADRQFKDYIWTTKVMPHVYNIYPIYDWRTEDIWRYHGKFPEKPHNHIYDKMYKAGVKISQQRLCQPYGDDQRRGLWLYHILEPETWFKLIARVNGANTGSLYVQENGNIMGYNKITKPENHTWRSFCNLLLQTMPKKTREHYIFRFKKMISSWRDRGYEEIPDEAPPELESKCWVPSWRRMCRCLLRNDYWCKGLGQMQPKSDAYWKYREIVDKKKELRKAAKNEGKRTNRKVATV